MHEEDQDGDNNPDTSVPSKVLNENTNAGQARDIVSRNGNTVPQSDEDLVGNANRGSAEMDMEGDNASHSTAVDNGSGRDMDHAHSEISSGLVVDDSPKSDSKVTASNGSTDVEERIMYLEEIILKQKDELADQNRKITSQEDLIGNLIQTSDEQQFNYKKTTDNLNEQISDMVIEHTSHIDKLIASRNLIADQLDGVHQKYIVAKLTIDDRENEMRAMKREKEMLITEVESLNRELAAAHEAIRTCQESAMIIGEYNSELESRVSDDKCEIEQLKTTNAQLRDDIFQLRRNCNDAMDESLSNKKPLEKPSTIRKKTEPKLKPAPLKEDTDIDDESVMAKPNLLKEAKGIDGESVMTKPTPLKSVNDTDDESVMAKPTLLKSVNDTDDESVMAKPAPLEDVKGSDGLFHSRNIDGESAMVKPTPRKEDKDGDGQVHPRNIKDESVVAKTFPRNEYFYPYNLDDESVMIETKPKKESSHQGCLTPKSDINRERDEFFLKVTNSLLKYEAKKKSRKEERDDGEDVPEGIEGQWKQSNESLLDSLANTTSDATPADIVTEFADKDENFGLNEGFEHDYIDCDRQIAEALYAEENPGHDVNGLKVLDWDNNADDADEGGATTNILFKSILDRVLKSLKSLKSLKFEVTSDADSVSELDHEGLLIETSDDHRHCPNLFQLVVYGSYIAEELEKQVDHFRRNLTETTDLKLRLLSAEAKLREMQNQFSGTETPSDKTRAELSKLQSELRVNKTKLTELEDLISKTEKELSKKLGELSDAEMKLEEREKQALRLKKYFDRALKNKLGELGAKSETGQAGSNLGSDSPIQIEDAEDNNTQLRELLRNTSQAIIQMLENCVGVAKNDLTCVDGYTKEVLDVFDKLTREINNTEHQFTNVKTTLLLRIIQLEEEIKLSLSSRHALQENYANIKAYSEKLAEKYEEAKNELKIECQRLANLEEKHRLEMEKIICEAKQRDIFPDIDISLSEITSITAQAITVAFENLRSGIKSRCERGDVVASSGLDETTTLLNDVERYLRDQLKDYPLSKKEEQVEGLPVEPNAGCAENEAVKHLENEAAGHPENEAVKHLENEAAGHPENEAVKHLENEAAGHPENEAVKHLENEAAGHPENETVKHLENEAAEHPDSVAAVHPASEAAGHPKTEADGHPANEAVEHPKTEAAGHPANDAAEHLETEAAGHPANEASGHREKESTKPTLLGIEKKLIEAENLLFTMYEQLIVEKRKLESLTEGTLRGEGNIDTPHLLESVSFYFRLFIAQISEIREIFPTFQSAISNLRRRQVSSITRNETPFSDANSCEQLTVTSVGRDNLLETYNGRLLYESAIMRLGIQYLESLFANLLRTNNPKISLIDVLRQFEESFRSLSHAPFIPDGCDSYLHLTDDIDLSGTMRQFEFGNSRDCVARLPQVAIIPDQCRQNLEKSLAEWSLSLEGAIEACRYSRLHDASTRVENFKASLLKLLTVLEELDRLTNGQLETRIAALSTELTSSLDEITQRYCALIESPNNQIKTTAKMSNSEVEIGSFFKMCIVTNLKSRELIRDQKVIFESLRTKIEERNSVSVASQPSKANHSTRQQTEIESLTRERDGLQLKLSNALKIIDGMDQSVELESADLRRKLQELGLDDHEGDPEETEEKAPHD